MPPRAVSVPDDNIERGFFVRQNFLKQKLESGSAVIGTWAVIPSPVVSDIIATSGIDFIIIDSEHGPINFETAQQMVIACESRGVSPVMRVGGVVEAEILRALDIGTHCVQIPNVTTHADVERLVKYIKYPPIGNRGFSPFTRAGNYSLENAHTLTTLANESVLTAINIEGKDAIDNIDEILQSPHLDIIFLGLFDISKSMGMPGEVDSPVVLTCLEKLTNKINQSGKYPGTIVTNVAKMSQFINMGIKYITYSVDCEIMSSSYKTIATNFRSLIAQRKKV